MQLSVAIGQQPIRGNGSHKLQPVVATTKEAAKHAFAELLNAELTRVGIPDGRARIGAIHKALRVRGKSLVSREQVRKWVRGIDIPDQANLRAVCTLLKLDWARLQTGTPTLASPQFLELQALWDVMDDVQRASLLNFARFTRDEAHLIKARPEGKDSDHSEDERASLQRVRRI